MAALIPRPDDAAALARRLGATAFTAFVVLFFEAQQADDGRLLVAVSARALAARLGMGKDAAAVALRRLSAAGLLLDAPGRQESTGRFAVAVRELRAVEGIGPCRHFEDTAFASSPRRTRTPAREVDAQLDLFAACSDNEANEESQFFDLENRISRIHKDRELEEPESENRSLRSTSKTCHDEAAWGQTRLHRGCDDVAADVPAVSPPEAGGSPC